MGMAVAPPWRSQTRPGHGQREPHVALPAGQVGRAARRRAAAGSARPSPSRPPPVASIAFTDGAGSIVAPSPGATYAPRAPQVTTTAPAPSVQDPLRRGGRARAVVEHLGVGGAELDQIRGGEELLDHGPAGRSTAAGVGQQRRAHVRVEDPQRAGHRPGRLAADWNGSRSRPIEPV